MEFLNDYMIPIIIGICLCVGFVIKKWVRDVDNKFIPTILAILGIVLSMWISNWKITPEVILSGMVSGLASTGLHQAFTQFIDKKDTTE